MSETAEITAPRIVDYVDPDVIAALPASFPCAWIAEESCRRVSDKAAELAPAAREALLIRATDFAEEVLGVLKLEALPEAIQDCLFVDPHDRLHLIGARGKTKIRVDEDFRIAYLREKPLTLAGPRAGTLRQEARDLLTTPLASADKRPVMTIQAIDLSSVGEGSAFFLELDAPTGTGYRMGRADRLRIFGDGKVLILCFRPMPDVDEEGYQVGNPDAALARLPGSAAVRLAEIEAAEDGGSKMANRLKAVALAQAAKNAAAEADALDAEIEGAGGSAGGAAAAAAAARAEEEEARKRAETSESIFDRPGWTADVAPTLD